MSIAEKETIISANNLTIAEKAKKVYNAGYEKGKSEGGGLPAEFEWAKHNDRVTITDVSWIKDNDVLYFPNVNYFATFLQNAKFNNVKTLTIKSDVPIIHANNFLSSSTSITQTLERLILECDFSQCPYFNKFLQIQRNLISIEGVPIDFSSNTDGVAFEYTNNLTSFRVAQDSIKSKFNLASAPKLDADTIQSIIDGLADLTGNDTKTLTLHSTVKGKLTDAQIATITGKNWTIA